MKNKLNELLKKARQEVKLDQDLVILTAASSILASYGVKQDNVYILIASMLISPLFNPIVSVVVFSKSLDIKGTLKSLKTLLVVLSLSVGISGIFWILLALIDPKPLSDLIVTNPNLSFDTLILAIIMGFVGTLLWIWKDLTNTYAGVAVAISLVPPIAYFTFNLISWNLTHAFEYLKILGVNLAGIFIGALMVLILYSKGRYKTKL